MLNDSEALTCMVTGHRAYDPEMTDYVTRELDRLIFEAISEGYTHFLSGYASGADLTFAEIVGKYKETYNITLEAAIPYRGRLRSSDPRFKNAMKLCDKVTVYGEKYDISLYMLRNMAMVDASNRILAVYDYRGDGGTYNTITYASKSNRNLHIVDLRRDLL